MGQVVDEGLIRNEPAQKHKILLAASEVVGFAKTGGLADVAGSLPRALAQRGHTCAVIMPLYRAAHVSIPADALTPHEVAAAVLIAAGL